MEKIIREIISNNKSLIGNYVIGSILDAGKYYIVNLADPKAGKDDFLLDCQYKYFQKTKKLVPFRASENYDDYEYGLNHIIYRNPSIFK